MGTMCVGLENPQGTIDQFGVSANGSLSEVDIIAAVSVPDGDTHHLLDFTMSGLVGSSKTIFRLYYRISSTSTWVQINELPISDYGLFGQSVSVSHKIKAGEQWKMTGQQSVVGRMSVRVGGQAKKFDSRTAV